MSSLKVPVTLLFSQGQGQCPTQRTCSLNPYGERESQPDSQCARPPPTPQSHGQEALTARFLEEEHILLGWERESVGRGRGRSWNLGHVPALDCRRPGTSVTWGEVSKDLLYLIVSVGNPVTPGLIKLFESPVGHTCSISFVA